MQKQPTKSISSIWDKKAHHYARFSKEPSSFTMKILDKIASRGILFHNQNVLDIGCGTGVYTLHIAHVAKSVNALDISQEMLDILRQDAQNEHLLDKLTFTCKPWSDFWSEQPFDIIFSSMSPAFQSDNDFEKMNTLCSHYCVYLGWGGKRESKLQDEVFKAHGLNSKVPPGSEKIKAWLDKKNITYTKEYIEDEWVTNKPYQEAIDSMLWHLEINEVKANVPLVKKIVRSHCDANGTVNVHVKVGLELISWEKG